MNADQTILSNTIARDIYITAHNLSNSDSICFILSGDLTGDKLLAID